jgi:hypothetical protein
MKVTSFHSSFLMLAVFSLSILIPNAKLIPNAAPIQGVSLGTFLNSQPTCPPAVCTGLGTDFFTWGTPVDSPDGHVSSFSFLGRSFATEEGQTFVAGELEYYNGTIKGGTGVDLVNLCIQATITDPEPQILSGCRNIYIINTPNTSDPIASADSVTMQIGPNFFVLEGGSASATVLAKIRESTVISGRSSMELELEIVGFGEVTGGNGFLRSFVYLPLIQRGP